MRAILLVAIFSAGLVQAETKSESCEIQGDVVAAVKQARIDRVKEREVEETLIASEPVWPEKFNKMIPLVTPWVYEMKRRDVKQKDLRAAWIEICLQQ